MFLAATIGKHPARAAKVLMALLTVLVILVIMAIYYYRKWKKCVNPKSNFEAAGISPISNMSTGMASPLWWGGSADAGEGGSLDRDTTPVQTAVYLSQKQPMVRRVLARRAAAMRAAGRPTGVREPWTNPQYDDKGMPLGCPPGTALATVGLDAQGNPIKLCGTPSEIDTMELDSLPDVDADDFDWSSLDHCGGPWNPEATLQSQALVSVGGIDPPTYGERRLDNAMEGVYDTSKGLSDADLTTLMRYGGAP